MSEQKEQTPNKDLGHLKQMFNEYKKKQENQKRGKSRDDILKKYFVPRNSKEIFRILQPKKGRKPIEEAFFHVVPILIAGGKVKHSAKIYCPRHNDPKTEKLDEKGNPVLDDKGKPVMVNSPCPLCDKSTNILSKQDKSILSKIKKKEDLNEKEKGIKAQNDKYFKDAMKWQAKKFYIIKGIDRGVEKDGVKFWRFKHNVKNQGTLDKLLPILEDFMINQKADFADSNEGTDLSITMTDSEFQIGDYKGTYKAISAISYRGKSPLHSDPIVAQSWLEDETTWRDVFLPKRAPSVEPYKFLQMIADGCNPYWDDTDSENKRWVCPNNPELEKIMNTRDRDLDSDDISNDIEQASDLDETGKPVSISNVSEKNVGEYKDNAVDMGNLVDDNEDDDNTKQEDDKTDETNNNESSNDSDDDMEDLPF